jgi:hypothetical protein
MNRLDNREKEKKNIPETKNISRLFLDFFFKQDPFTQTLATAPETSDKSTDTNIYSIIAFIYHRSFQFTTYLFCKKAFFMSQKLNGIFIKNGFNINIIF